MSSSPRRLLKETLDVRIHPAFNLADLGYVLDAPHPACHVNVRGEPFAYQLLCKDTNALNLTEHLQIVASNVVATEVIVSIELLI